MRGLGTIINFLLATGGGVVGLLFGSRISKSMRETLNYASGLAIMFLAIGGTMSKMLAVKGGSLSQNNIMMMMISLTAGSAIGEIINIQKWIEKFGVFLRRVTKNTGDPEFIDAFISGTCTVCIGAMAIIGSIEDAVNGNYTILTAKGFIDAVILCVMAASLGKGAAFSSISILVFQGIVEIIAGFGGQFMTQTALNNLSYVGNVLIFAVGINLIWDKNIRVANMLPALIIAILWH